MAQIIRFDPALPPVYDVHRRGGQWGDDFASAGRLRAEIGRRVSARLREEFGGGYWAPGSGRITADDGVRIDVDRAARIAWTEAQDVMDGAEEALNPGWVRPSRRVREHVVGVIGLDDPRHPSQLPRDAVGSL
jgi:hypothetical protein